MWKKQVAMLYYVDICVILCKDPVKEMKHGSFQEEKGMLAIERQEQIVSQIRRNGAVRIHELTKQFSVSVETIRRDLLELERQDCLHRVLRRCSRHSCGKSNITGWKKGQKKIRRRRKNFPDMRQA